MEKSEFDALFESEVANKAGFVKSGKSVYFKNEIHTIALMRLGGRMAAAGSISYLICCRHSFLRNADEIIPEKLEKDVFAYPIKIKPTEVKKGLFGLGIKYTPKNLNFDFEVFTYSNKSEVEVKQYLAKVSKAVDLIKEWFINQPPSKLAFQISTNGTNSWIEKLWIEDYENMAI
ncbi:hypothetical protein ISG33_08805 [Glaciecola sp. MH2013]|uniref:hypothetical protein n=1 Tax=Glaciecola sp. MH2013 TaxID=2785524 RepID=UPI00189DD13F|nr:hypothetical protein [Glaciecola sp. MH2013]MBF7073492.1 hypothetical protein [Glaciecola sp. MH2013]